MGAHIFQKSMSHLKIQGTRRVTCSKLHIENPLVLGTNVPNLITTATWYLGFVQSSYKLCIVLYINYQLDALTIIYS